MAHQPCSLYLITILTLIICSVRTDGVINGLPITFTMSGPTSYSPDLGGGIKQGYLLTIGFTSYSWLGIQFISSGGNNDLLVLQIDDFYTDNGSPLNTGHLVSYTDYYVSPSGSVVQDSNTANDVSSYKYTSTKRYDLQTTRFSGSNGGQDWDGDSKKYSVQQVCFYTSDATFDSSTYKTFYSACYFYEIDNYVSTFVGVKLKSFNLNGYPTGIYGYIDGPLVKNKVYFYQQTPLFSYVQDPAAVIEIGTVSGNYGQDFYAFSTVTNEIGDYFGSSVNDMKLDNTANGFQNPALTIKTWNTNPANQITGLSITALRIFFSRDVYTYDPYDKELLSTFLFCIYFYSSGSISSALSDKSC